MGVSISSRISRGASVVRVSDLTALDSIVTSDQLAIGGLSSVGIGTGRRRHGFTLAGRSTI